ncbi:hypothetical protein E3W21_29635 [Pseudomonas sp. F01002]|nr:hypothetical protein E3W21_29635 [Pseudomonas sp. F01002]
MAAVTVAATMARVIPAIQPHRPPGVAALMPKRGMIMACIAPVKSAMTTACIAPVKLAMTTVCMSAVNRVTTMVCMLVASLAMTKSPDNR